MSRCDVCLSDDNDGVSCEECSIDYTPELEELARLRVEVARLRTLLDEALEWAAPYRGIMPPDSCSEMMPTMSRIAGRDRFERLAAIRAAAEEAP